MSEDKELDLKFLQKALQLLSLHPEYQEFTREAFVKSFAFGNVKLSNDKLTFKHIEDAYEDLHGKTE